MNKKIILTANIILSIFFCLALPSFIVELNLLKDSMNSLKYNKDSSKDYFFEFIKQENKYIQIGDTKKLDSNGYFNSLYDDSIFTNAMHVQEKYGNYSSYMQSLATNKVIVTANEYRLYVLNSNKVEFNYYTEDHNLRIAYYDWFSMDNSFDPYILLVSYFNAL